VQDACACGRRGGWLEVAGALRSPHDELVVAPRARSGTEADDVARLVRGEHATTRPVEQLVGERRLELAHAPRELGDLVLELEHAADALETDPLRAEPRDLTQLADVAHRVAARLPRGAARAHETQPVVLPERLRVHAAQLRRS